MRVVAGLGNPGKTYAASLHNLGFRVVERLATLAGAGPWEQKFDGLLATVGQGDTRVLLLKPQTYMNSSGRAVAALLRFYTVELADLLVIVDDLDLELGKVRLRDSGSDGGHRGLRSVIGECGSQSFKRIRIGVGRPPSGRSVIAHVLGRTSSAEEARKLEAAVETAGDRAQAFMETGAFENWSSPD